MVSIEKNFNRNVSAIRKNPKIMLPLTLNWLPQIIVTTSLALISRDFIKNTNIQLLYNQLELSPIETLISYLEAYIPLFSLILIAALASIFIYSYVKAIYPTLSEQIYYNKKISLKEATSTARHRFLDILWTNILYGIIAYILFGILIISSSVAMIKLGETSTTLALISLIIALILGIELVIHLLATWVILDPVVILENEVGLKAMRKAHNSLKGKIREVLVFILFLTIANAIFFATAGYISAIFQYSPIAEYTNILEMLILLFPNTFILLAYGTLYLEIKEKN